MKPNPEMLSLREMVKIAAHRGLSFGVAPLAGLYRLHRQLLPRIGAAGGRDDPLALYGVLLAQVPGTLGRELRAAFYGQTLRRCGWNLQLGPGSYFESCETEVGDNLRTGSFCTIGRSTIGHDVSLEDHVCVVDGSGRREDLGEERHVSIGSYVHVGVGARIAASVGDKATVRIGAVVTRPVPRVTTVQGNPARALRR